MAVGMADSRFFDQSGSTAQRAVPDRISEPTTQVPADILGKSPPATPKLMIPRQFFRTAREIANSSPSSLQITFLPQITYVPAPAAIRASNASPTTIITVRVDRAPR